MNSDGENEASLDDVTRDFSRALDGEKSAQIEDYLAAINPEQRDALLCKLIRAEIAHRHQVRVPADEQEYHRRFPNDGLSVTRAFAQSRRETPLSIDNDSIGRTADFSLPEDRRIGSYVIERELGRDGMGIVHLARREGDSESVALKVLPTVDGASLHRFKREFRSLADKIRLR